MSHITRKFRRFKYCTQQICRKPIPIESLLLSKDDEKAIIKAIEKISPLRDICELKRAKDNE